MISLSKVFKTAAMLVLFALVVGTAVAADRVTKAINAEGSNHDDIWIKPEWITVHSAAIPASIVGTVGVNGSAFGQMSVDANIESKEDLVQSKSIFCCLMCGVTSLVPFP